MLHELHIVSKKQMQMQQVILPATLRKVLATNQ
jgi:hypothetical protein